MFIEHKASLHSFLFGDVHDPVKLATKSVMHEIEFNRYFAFLCFYVVEVHMRVCACVRG